MSIEVDGRTYSEDEVVVIPTGRGRTPYVAVAVDGSGVFVARQDEGALRYYRADEAGIEAIAGVLRWDWLLERVRMAGV
jgi:hypothetical protein